MKKLDRILVPVDTSESSDRAVALAGELAAAAEAADRKSTRLNSSHP